MEKQLWTRTILTNAGKISAHPYQYDWAAEKISVVKDKGKLWRYKLVVVLSWCHLLFQIIQLYRFVGMYLREGLLTQFYLHIGWMTAFSWCASLHLHTCICMNQVPNAMNQLFSLNKLFRG